MSNLLHYRQIITSLQTSNKTFIRWLGKAGSANKKRTTFIVKYKVSKSFVWIETPRCWVADTEDLWAAHGPFLLRSDLATIRHGTGWQERLSISVILRHNKIKNSQFCHRQVQCNQGLQWQPRVPLIDKNSSAPLLRAWWAFESQYGQLRTLETSWLAETSVNAYCHNFIFPVLPALEHFLHFPLKGIYSETTVSCSKVKSWTLCVTHFF